METGHLHRRGQTVGPARTAGTGQARDAGPLPLVAEAASRSLTGPTQGITPVALLHLQRTAGNGAVSAFLAEVASRQRPSPSSRGGSASPPGAGGTAAETSLQRFAPFNWLRQLGGDIRSGVTSLFTGIQGVLTPRDAFAGRSQGRFGVGEVIDLSFTAHPPRTAASMGGLTWSIESGPGTIVSAVNGTGTYTADHLPGVVTLALKVASGTKAGDIVATRTFTVVEPSDALMVRQPGTGVWHTHGTCTVGFRGEAFLRPKDVSFERAEWREGTVAGTATGYLATLGKNGEVHSVGSWMTISGGNSATGNKVNMFDTVQTGTYRAPYGAGTFTWPIPWEFRVAGSAAKKFTTATHFEETLADGTASISKKGAGPVTRRPSDPTSSF